MTHLNFKFHFYLIIGFVLLLNINANSQSQFQRTFIGMSSTGSKTLDIERTSEDSLMFCGTYGSVGPNTYSFLMKTDINCNPMWNLYFGYGGSDIAWKVKTDDYQNNYTLGYRYSSNISYGIISKFDRNGNHFWSRTFGGNEDDDLRDGVFDGDSIIVIGNTKSYGPGVANIMAIKLEENGDTIWSRVYGNGNEWGYKIIPTFDENFIISGNSLSIGQGSQDIFLLKIDSNGDTLWTKTFGFPGNESGSTIAEDSEGNLYISGQTTAFTSGAFVMKINPVGNEIWTKVFEPTSGYFGADENTNLKITSSNTIIGTFNSGNISGWNSSDCLMEFDLDGNLIWTKLYGGQDLKEVIEVPNGFVASGGIPFETSTMIYVLRTDSVGQTGCNEFTPEVVVTDIEFIEDSGILISSGVNYTTEAPTVVFEPIIDSLICGTICNYNLEIVGDTTACFGEDVVLSVDSGFSYDWSNGDDSDSTTINLQTDTLISITVTDGDCTYSDEIYIVVVEYPNLEIVGDSSVCIGDSISIYVDGAEEYIWENGETDSMLYVSLNSTEYISVTGNNSDCYATDSILINVIQLPVLELSGDTIICFEEDVMLNVNGADNYIWENGEEGNTFVNQLDSSDFISVQGSILDCSVSDSIFVNVIQPSTLNLNQDTTIQVGQSVTLLLGGCDSIIWYPLDFLDFNNYDSAISSPESTITYILVCLDEYGCATSDEITITVLDDTQLIIPNAISPNNDNSNDFWEIIGIENFSHNSLEVYNRWGDKVYEKENYNNSWDGSFDDKPLPGGVYYYILVLDDDIIYRGSLNIFR